MLRLGKNYNWGNHQYRWRMDNQITVSYEIQTSIHNLFELFNVFVLFELFVLCDPKRLYI